ncbi:hypothetical protein PINS_up010201 [Pythium insidiosum]|nr:hypothetical protein PINS_up010201 [Pythium insidiosum]
MSANQRGPENADAAVSCLFAIDPSTVKIGKEIGKGAFSVVYSGEFNKKRVAVKCQPKDEHGAIPPFVLKEVQILQRLHHPNVLEFIGAADNRKTRQILILSEHSHHGDLDQLLRNIRKGVAPHLGWTKMVQIALDVARGIAFLHAQRFIHRDIKSSNILLDEQFCAKLCDFGFATETSAWDETSDGATDANTSSKRRKSYCGTDAFMAPEMFLDEDYNENVDVFSFGVVLMELICCRVANKDGFVMRLPQHKFCVVMSEFYDAMPSTCPPAFARIAEQCVAFEPTERPTSADVVRSLEDVLALGNLDCAGAVELRAFTPTVESSCVDSEPQIDDDEDDDEDEDDDDGDDDESDAGANLDEEDADDSSSAPVLPPPYHTGVLLKRNRRGNRGWSEKLFILDCDHLHYVDAPTKSTSTTQAKQQHKQQQQHGGHRQATATPKNERRMSLSAQPTMSSLSLRECRIWKVSDARKCTRPRPRRVEMRCSHLLCVCSSSQTMEMPELCFNILNGSWKICRELRATSREDLEKWMQLIEQAIDYANDQAHQKASTATTIKVPLSVVKPTHTRRPSVNNLSTGSGSHRSTGSRGSRERSHGKAQSGSKLCDSVEETRQPETTKSDEPTCEDRDEDEVFEWLRALGLERFTGTFKAKGFTSVDFIREVRVIELCRNERPLLTMICCDVPCTSDWNRDGRPELPRH